MTKLNQATLDAIERHLPMYLQVNHGSIAIMTTTRQNENGSQRCRKLAWGSLPWVIQAVKAIFDAGGAVDIDSLPWWTDQFNAWDYGWSMGMDKERDELRALWRLHCQRPHQQPVW